MTDTDLESDELLQFWVLLETLSLTCSEQSDSQRGSSLAHSNFRPESNGSHSCSDSVHTKTTWRTGP